jgi:hypothetical protein
MAFPDIGGRNPFRHDCPLACGLAMYSMRHSVAQVGIRHRPAVEATGMRPGASAANLSAASKALAPLRLRNHPPPRPRLKISPDEHGLRHSKYSYHRRTYQHR